MDLLQGALTVIPSQRLTVAAAVRINNSFLPSLRCVVSATPAGRGPFTLVSGILDRKLINWLQNDPFWTKLVSQEPPPKKQCMTEAEAAFKFEGGGHVTNEAPGCKTFCNTDQSKPFPAERVSQFVQEFRRVNEKWLMQLTTETRAALDQLPEEVLGENGHDFYDSCFSATSFVYGVFQRMKASPRLDPEHFDGGASLLHAGLTIWGRRRMEYQLEGNIDWHGLEMEAGSFYVGNLSSVLHRVVHGEVSRAEGIITREADWIIAVMLHSDASRHARARMQSKPPPTDVYDIVNDVVARRLARVPLVLPSFAGVVRGKDPTDFASADSAVATPQ